MLLHRNQPSPSPPRDPVPVAGLIGTHWVLSVCVVCGHERPHGERHRASCPTCGAQLLRLSAVPRSAGRTMSAIEERIRKLLALADSPNENEAAAAAEKAQALMLRYGNEMAAVAAAGGERLAVDEHVVGGKVDPWRRMLAAAVARSAAGEIVWAPEGDGRAHGKIFFYGPSGTVGGIVELYRYLEAQLVVISATATAARRERRVHGRRWRNSFLLGAVGRIAQRLQARRAETAEAGENGGALVLVKTAVDREIERRHPELESSSYRASVARGAYEAGAHAGKHVDLGERRLGRSSPALPDAAAG
jgi:predicted RNA-binding Zn-ribbon protein involved in translation (DUF1610 family)